MFTEKVREWPDLHLMYQRLCKRPYTRFAWLWRDNSTEFQRLLTELASKTRLKRGRLREISTETGIKYKTLDSWRRHLQQDPNWHPEYGHPTGPAILTEEEEAEVVDQLTRDYIDVQRFCPTYAVAHALTVQGQKTHGEQFQAGRTLVRNFLKRAKLSMRKPHLRRRSAPDDEAVSNFLGRVDLVTMQFPPCLILNVDETCWRLVNGTLKTLARTGAEEVNVISKATEKTDITVIACCSLAGDCLPLWVLAKGKTNKCEEKYRTAPQLQRAIGRQLFVDHSKTGWSTADVMKRYLTWLKEHMKGKMIHVIWDLHASHRDAEVQEWAQQAEIGLTFIPAGQTDIWQPLDRRVFGSLKQRAVRKLHEQMVDRELADYDIRDAIKILLDSWSEITEEEIESAWQPLIV